MRGKRWLAVLFPLVAVALDRILKWHSFAALPPEGAVLFTGMEYKMFLNTGLVFSLSNNLVAIVFWMIAAIALACWLAAKIRRDRSWIGKPANLCAVLLIALGGASNLADRIFAHGVIDYFLLFSRSAINLADIMILAGILLLVTKSGPEGGQTAKA